MNKTKRLAAFEGIDTDILNGSPKNKKIVKLFLKGMTYREITNEFELTVSRIGQILDKQARTANSYKNLQNDSEYQTHVKEYA